jgi:predicted transcriptional regulator of viral defense system
MATAEKIPSVRTLKELVDWFQASGRYTFSRREALRALKSSAPNLKRAAMRLAIKGRVVVPRRGFYVIVPLEYRAAGAPPPSWFIDQLMHHLGHPYYVGLLSAAALYGAAHQQPQEYQVMTDAPQRPIKVGRVRIRFLVKRRIDRIPTQEQKTETGILHLSSPEVTAIDLLRYTHAAGGLDNVATVLEELAERIDKQKLAEAARLDGELAYAQRLGHVLEAVGAQKRTSALAAWIRERNPRTTPLNPRKPVKGQRVDQRWHIVVNDKIEGEF